MSFPSYCHPIATEYRNITLFSQDLLLYRNVKLELIMLICVCATSGNVENESQCDSSDELQHRATDFKHYYAGNITNTYKYCKYHGIEIW